jgi:hypothetical protein
MALVLGVGVSLVALVLATGALLPPNHTARSRAVFAHSSPERVWALLSDFEGWPSWNSAATEVRRMPDRDGKPAFLHIGGFGEMPTIVESAHAPRRLVTSIPADAQLGFHGTWTYEILPAGAGCEVHITEEGTVDSPLFRFFSLFTSPHSTMDATLRALGAALGESGAPEHVTG